MESPARKKVEYYGKAANADVPEAANDNDFEPLKHANDNDENAFANDNDFGPRPEELQSEQEGVPEQVPLTRESQVEELVANLAPAGAGEPPEDTPNQPKKEEFTFEPSTIAIVDASDAVDTAARDAADERMTANKEDLKGVKGFVKKIWKHNLFHEYYRQKEQAKSKEEIVESGNIYATEGKEIEAHKEAMSAIVNRFTSEYEEVIHTEAGEERRVIDDSAENSGLNKQIRGIVNSFATGAIDEETFKAERDRLVANTLYQDEEMIKKGVSHTDNLLEIAQNAKTAYEHGWSLDKINDRINIVAGRAKVGVRTEAGLSTVDRIVDKVKKTAVGKLLNETTISGGVAIAYSATVGLSERVARSQLFAWGTMGASTLLGGAIAGVRENLRLKEERRQHSRDRAKGKTFAEGAERRKEMEGLIYQTAPSSFLIESLSHLPQHFESEEQYKDALSTLAETEARISLSDQNNMDLIAFSGVENVEIERLELDIARAEAKIKLRESYESSDFPKEKSFADMYAEALSAKKQEMYSGSEGIEARDRLFNKMKRAQVAKTAVKAATIGLAIGATAQEGYAALSNEQVGVFEGIFSSEPNPEAESKTALEGLRGWLFGDVSPEQFRDVQIETLSNGATISVPEGAELTVDAANPDVYTFTMDGDEVGAIEFVDGALTPDSVLTLEASGVYVDTEDFSVATTAAPTEFTAAEYASQSEDFREIDRSFWYDNDTAAPVFDRNELGLHWGGENGIDQDGNYVFSVSTMTSEGSFHDSLSVDAQEAVANGELKVLLSLSEDSQTHVVEVPIDSEGRAIIDPESTVGKTFFREEDGELVFLGRFAEVAHQVGQGEDGVPSFAMLATYEGEGVDQVVGEGAGVEDKTLTMLGATEPDLPVDAFMPIPVIGRKPLEPSEAKGLTDMTTGYYGYGGEGYGLLDRSKYKERYSDKIKENSELDLSGDDSEIVDEYLDKQSEVHTQTIVEMIADAPVMKESIKAAITVPAYKEGKNLEKTIRNYAKLKNRDTFELVILENHPSSVDRDNSAEVIEQMKQEFPDMNIIHLYREYEEKPAIGKIRKDLVDAVLARKRIAGKNESIAIISNDADLEDINEDYVEHIVGEFEKNPKTDAIGGKWDYPSTDFEKFPLMHATQRLWHYIDIAFRNYYLKSPELIGRNSAFRSGAYAAIGGYGDTSRLAEDLEIGWMIKDARDYNSDSISYKNPAWLVSNSRRATINMLSGRNLVEQYGDFHENEQVRDEDADKMLENGVDFDEQQFQEQAQALYRHYGQFKKSNGGWCDDKYVNKSFNRAMRFLGVQYKVVRPGEIEITDMSKLKKGLKV